MIHRQSRADTTYSRLPAGRPRANIAPSNEFINGFEDMVSSSLSANSCVLPLWMRPIISFRGRSSSSEARVAAVSGSESTFARMNSKSAALISSRKPSSGTSSRVALSATMEEVHSAKAADTLASKRFNSPYTWHESREKVQGGGMEMISKSARSK